MYGLEQRVETTVFSETQGFEAFSMLVDHLADKGYELIGKLSDDGKTKSVYEALYRNGAVNKKRVVTVSKDSIDSITAKINQSKRDINENEINFSNVLNHDKLIEVIDHFKFDNRDIMIEQYLDGVMNLESYLNISGGLARDKGLFKEIADQMFEAYSYLDSKQVLHRDIKPNNFIIDENKRVKLIDLQNCSHLSHIQESTFPTRGGSAYTSPSLLNALITQTPAKASKNTELYSFTATLYTLITGDTPLDYGIKSVNGLEFDIGDGIDNIRLYIDGEQASHIDTTQHNKRVEKAVRKAPRRAQKFLKKGLSLDNDYTLDDLKRDYTSFVNESWFTSKMRKKVTGVAAGLALLVGGSFFLQNAADSYSQVKHADLHSLEKTVYTNQNSGSYAQQEFLTRLLAHRAGPLVQQLKTVDTDYSLLSESHKYDIPKRELTTLMVLSDVVDPDELEDIYGDEQRLYPFLTPLSYHSSDGSSLSKPRLDYVGDGKDISYEGMMKRRFVSDAAQYFRELNEQNGDVLEALADYIIPIHDQMNARQNSPVADTYFPVLDNEGRIQREGYAESINNNTKSLVEQVALIYMVTDDDGVVDIERLKSLSHPGNHILSKKLYADHMSDKASGY